MSDVTRRTLLVAGAGGAGALVLAGCSSSGSEDGGGEPTTTTTTQPSSGAPSTSSSPASSAPASTSPGSPSAGSSSRGAATGTAIASLDDIEVGAAKSVKLANGNNGIVTRLTATTAVAFSARCTHEGCTVKPDGAKLACPCHGSTFDAKTGDVLNGPAPSALEKVTVTVSGNKVLES